MLKSGSCLISRSKSVTLDHSVLKSPRLLPRVSSKFNETTGEEDEEEEKEGGNGREVDLLNARIYMHRGVEERKRSVGRSVPAIRQVGDRDEGELRGGREIACEPHFPMHLVRPLHRESVSDGLN